MHTDSTQEFVWHCLFVETNVENIAKSNRLPVLRNAIKFSEEQFSMA
jgi:hypothetical protein